MKNNNIGFYIAILFVLISAIGANNLAAQICTPVPIGLISSYSGDGNTLDARARNNGTIQNGVTYAAGKVGQAFNLAGNNGDRVLLGNPTDFRRQDLTIEAWVKRSSSSVVTNSGSAGLFFAYGQSGYAFYIKGDNKLTFGQVGVSEISAPTLTITDTNWHHVAVTQAGPPFTAGTQAVFYLDGVADTPVGYGPSFSFSTNAAIGTRGDGTTSDVFFGAIDELAIYDRALSAAQIQAIFASGTAGKCKPLATNAPDNQVLWLAGDGDANDISGNGNNGTSAGAVYQVGKVGQAFQFDGTAQSQYTIPDSQSLRPTTAVTVEAWLNPSSTQTGFQSVLFKGSTGSPGGQPYSLFVNGVNHQIVVRVGNDSAFEALDSVSGIPANTYSHVAFTYDGTTIRIYINGVLDASAVSSIGNLAQANTQDLRIGGLGSSSTYTGAADEIGIYNRALSLAEIQSISNAGLAGKYKVQATVPVNIAAWYPGDGNTNDLQAANNGTLQGGATYANGKVGQAFSLNGTTSYVSAPSTAGNDPTGASQGASMEVWVQFNQRPSDAGHPFYIISKDGPTFGASDAFHLRADADNYIKFQWQGGGATTTAVSVQTGVWYHVVGTFSPTQPICKFYINGVFQANGSCSSIPRTPSNLPLTIGRNTQTAGNTFFNGLIDEPAIYNRTLSEAEIRDQYYAGSLGKYKGAANPTVQNKTRTGDATVTFGSITTTGSVHQTPLDTSLLPALPMGTNTGLNYDISTSAVYTNPSVCLNMSSFTTTQFTNLRIYHLESGAWVNRTAGANTYPNLCSSGLTSLSPFAVVSVISTAANVSVGGRVIGVKGGLNNVTVTLTGGSLPAPVTIKTSSFGYYNFENLSVGETYFVTVSSKRFTFSPNTRTVTPNQDIADLDFTAENP